MRTSDICPTCSIYTNALCTLYNGAYLPTLQINTLESLETALIKIENWASTITPTALGDITDVDLTGLIDGQMIVWNSTSGMWEPAVVPASSPAPVVYRALLSQTGTAAPTVVVLENSLTETPIWSYNTVGEFYTNLSNSGLANQLFVYTGQAIGGNSANRGRRFTTWVEDTEGTNIWVYAEEGGTLANGIMVEVPIEIRSYV